MSELTAFSEIDLARKEIRTCPHELTYRFFQARLLAA